MDPLAWRLVRLLGPIALLAPFVAFYVYRDLRRRGRPRPLLWAVGLGCFGLYGLFAYLYMRGDFSRGG